LALVAGLCLAPGCGRGDNRQAQAPRNDEKGAAGRPVPGVPVPDRPEPAAPADTARKPAPPPPEAVLVLAVPTGSQDTGVLTVKAAKPDRVRAGQPYDCRLTLTNTTKNLTLERVRIHLEASDRAEVESFSAAARGPDSASAGQADQSDGKAGDADKGKAGDADKGKAGDADKGHGGRHGKHAKNTVVVDRLAPGESREVVARMVAQKEGWATACLGVSYETAVCLATEVVKPELRLTREAPAEADLCDPLTVRYVLKNDGSAPARGVRIHEKLPDGLTTADGKKEIDLDVGDVPAGGRREATAKLNADKPGEYGGRATAKGGETEASSESGTTKVRQARLEVAIDAPSVRYVGHPATFTVRVTNKGDAPAEEANLALDFGDKGLRIDEVDKVNPDDPAVAGVDAGDKPVARGLGTVRPGETREVGVTVTPREPGEIRLVATASSRCARKLDSASARAEKTAKVRSIPALRLTFYDNKDPVQVGDTTTYTARVINQGSAADKNVKVVVRLPDGMHYQSSQGPKPADSDGKTVTLGPLPELKAGDSATWNIVVKVNNPGDVRATADLTSDYLGTQPVRADEPTRMIP
jgi:uncharacterized repeat protein (TIGR01451 family)